MDLAYDHIQEEALSPDEIAAQEAEQEKQIQGNLNTELQEAYKSFSASPWGARLGGFLNTVKKQGETYYEGARQEAGAVGGDAVKGFTDLKSTLVSRARSMSAGQKEQPQHFDPFAGDDDETTTGAVSAEGTLKAQNDGGPAGKPRTESSTLASGSVDFIARFRSEATKRLADVQKAEDAADEALLRFGTNLSNFFKEAVTITAPTDGSNNNTFDSRDGKSSKILWESKAHDGKSVQHATRFEAQLHAIHSSYDSFTKDPVSDEYEPWTKDFDIEKKIDAIGKDLETYKELREAMERLVPEKVDYGTFWMRYYFLRMVVDMEEQRRMELLKGILSYCLFYVISQRQTTWLT